MKIAIYNGFPFHYEMFGYIIDYCKNKNIELDIYTETAHEMGWLKYYIINYNKYVKFFSLTNFNPDNNYNKIILTTDDDFKFKEDWINKKTICIDHHHTNRRPNVPIHISTRYFYTRPLCEWVLPVYRLIDVDTKKSITVKQIVCVGRANSPEIFFNFEKIFKNFNELQFIFIDRHIDCTKYENYSNIKCYNKLDTTEMINILKKSEYVFFSNNNKDHINLSMSGSIPLAFSCLCTCIMPQKMNEYYNFKSVITYNDKAIKIVSSNFDNVNTELEMLLEQKNKIFDKYFT